MTRVRSIVNWRVSVIEPEALQDMHRAERFYTSSRFMPSKTCICKRTHWRATHMH